MLRHGGTFPPCRSILQVLVSPRLCAVFLFRRHVRKVFDDDAEPFGCSVCLRPPKRRLSSSQTFYPDRNHRDGASPPVIGTSFVINCLNFKQGLVNRYSGSSIFVGSLLVLTFYDASSSDCPRHIHCRATFQRSVDGQGRRIEAAAHREVLNHT